MRVDSDQIPEGPPWQPQVWSVGPEALIATATQQLWVDQQDIGVVLDTPDRAMSGNDSSMQNENDQIIPPGPGGDGTRSGAQPNEGRLDGWDATVQDMRRTEPLAAWADGTHDGPANPNV